VKAADELADAISPDPVDFPAFADALAAYRTTRKDTEGPTKGMAEEAERQARMVESWPPDMRPADTLRDTEGES